MTIEGNASIFGNEGSVLIPTNEQMSLEVDGVGYNIQDRGELGGIIEVNIGLGAKKFSKQSTIPTNGNYDGVFERDGKTVLGFKLTHSV